MQEGKFSQTAQRVAVRRAAHQLHDHPRVLDDPLALRIIGPEAEAELRASRRERHGFARSFRALMAARSRYAEDMLSHAVERGVTQYVLLGAGLDTFAHRNPYSGLRVFEVDHLATQQWKRELLETTGLSIPTNLTYVPVDFERQGLPEQLQTAGFNPGVATFFAWLGVVPYLTVDAFRTTLAFIGTQPDGSGVVLDYAQPRSALPFFEKLAHDSLAARVQQAGEPFQLFFTPSEIAAELTAFREIEDLGASEINAHYFAGRSDNLKLIGSAGRILSAWV